MAEYVMEYDGWAEGIPVGEYLKVRNAMHARKREEVVRCRDCKRVTIDQGDHDYREPLWCGLFHIDVSLDGFCAWGRRADA